MRFTVLRNFDGMKRPVNDQMGRRGREYSGMNSNYDFLKRG